MLTIFTKTFTDKLAAKKGLELNIPCFNQWNFEFILKKNMPFEVIEKLIEQVMFLFQGSSGLLQPNRKFLYFEFYVWLCCPLLLTNKLNDLINTLISQAMSSILTKWSILI